MARLEKTISAAHFDGGLFKMGVMKGKDKKNKVRGFYLKVSNEVRGEKEEVDSRYKKRKKDDREGNRRRENIIEKN